MELRELHEVVWGDGYELYYIDDESTDPAYVGHFGYDDAKPRAYLGCTVTGVACVEGRLEVTATNPPMKPMGSFRPACATIRLDAGFGGSREPPFRSTAGQVLRRKISISRIRPETP